MAQDPIRSTLSRNLKHLRTERGLTQEDVAREVGMTWRNYQRCEKGTVVPRPANLELMAKALSVTPEALLGMEPGVEGKNRAVWEMSQSLATLETQVAELIAWKRDLTKARRDDIEG